MTTITQMLERLANAKDRGQIARMWHTYMMNNRKDKEIMRSLLDIKEISRIWKSNRMGVSRRAMGRR